ncbi:hypothetical protein AB0L40_24215 [Patulibacter sp. NPDC049589]|uniref:IS1096 element passenger TnpR family protein n=1 Tax=Patulibacter sp. NPDC049589 TaxID=3154731 RepID=UPI0034432B3F
MTDTLSLFPEDPDDTGSLAAAIAAADGTGPSAPAAWLLRLAAAPDGIPLQPTAAPTPDVDESAAPVFALAPSVVEAVVARWPSWAAAMSCDGDVVRRVDAASRSAMLHHEAAVPSLRVLRESLLRGRLVRRRGDRLLANRRGREVAEDGDRLVMAGLEDLDAGERFGDVIAGTALRALQAVPDGLAEERLAAAVDREGAAHGWRIAGSRGTRADGPQGASALGDPLAELLVRAEAYGIVERRATDGAGSGGVRLSEAGHRIRILPGGLFGGGALALAPPERPVDPSIVLVLHAKLEDVPRTSVTIEIGADQDFLTLHRTIQDAFRWADDHLWSFWLNGRYWGGGAYEVRSPFGQIDEETGARRADEVRLGEAGLRVGSTIAYLFDYGDAWRVALKVRAEITADGGGYPRIVARTGTPPPQYPGDEW